MIGAPLAPLRSSGQRVRFWAGRKWSALTYHDDTAEARHDLWRVRRPVITEQAHEQT